MERQEDNKSRNGHTPLRQVVAAQNVQIQTTPAGSRRKLRSLSDSFPKFLLTLNNDPVSFHDGIKIAVCARLAVWEIAVESVEQSESP